MSVVMLCCSTFRRRNGDVFFMIIFMYIFLRISILTREEFPFERFSATCVCGFLSVEIKTV